MYTGIRVKYTLFLTGFNYSSKNNHIKFYENLSVGSLIVACGRTDGHDEANFRFSQFSEPAKNNSVVCHRSVFMRRLILATVGIISRGEVKQRRQA
jgi:hypothetical protein